jgi:hypothetical protein
MQWTFVETNSARKEDVFSFYTSLFIRNLIINYIMYVIIMLMFESILIPSWQALINWCSGIFVESNSARKEGVFSFYTSLFIRNMIKNYIMYVIIMFMFESILIPSWQALIDWCPLYDTFVMSKLCQQLKMQCCMWGLFGKWKWWTINKRISERNKGIMLLLLEMRHLSYWGTTPHCWSTVAPFR